MKNLNFRSFVSKKISTRKKVKRPVSEETPLKHAHSFHEKPWSSEEEEPKQAAWANLNLFYIVGVFLGIIAFILILNSMSQDQEGVAVSALSVRVAATEALFAFDGTLAHTYFTTESAFVVDDVVLHYGDRVLLLHENPSERNGIYSVAGNNTLTRVADLARHQNIIRGMSVYVEEGLHNGKKTFNAVFSDASKSTYTFESSIDNLFPALEDREQLRNAVATYNPDISGAIEWQTLEDLLDTKVMSSAFGRTGVGTALDELKVLVDNSISLPNEGDLIVGQGAGLTAPLPIGTTGQILTANHTIPGKVEWSNPPIVTTVAGDYKAAEVSNVPAGNIAATDVQAALNELDAEKLDVSHFTTKGDLLAGTGVGTLNTLGAGADQTFLMANSVQAAGLQWQTLNGTLVTNIPAGTITSTDVQSAINELDNTLANYDVHAGNGLTETGSLATGTLKFNVDVANGAAISAGVPNKILDATAVSQITTLGTDTDKVPSQNAVKSYVDAAIMTQLSGGVDHDATLNFIALEHVNHACVSINSGVGLSGGGDITTSRTLSLDVTGTPALGSSPDILDEMLVYDTSGAVLRKITVSELSGGINHDTTLNFVANEHVDHSLVSITTLADTGLSGGGDLTVTRNLTVNITDTTGLAASPDTTDELLIYDTSGAVLRKITVAELSGGINHDTTLNFVANEHVDHSGVNISAGTGLTGGGDITASRTLNVDVAAPADVATGTAGKILDASVVSQTTTLGTSTSLVPSQNAVKAYIDSVVLGGVSDVLFYRGTLDASTNPNLSTGDTGGNTYLAGTNVITGDLFEISVSGTIVVSDGTILVQAGDMVMITASVADAAISLTNLKRFKTGKAAYKYIDSTDSPYSVSETDQFIGVDVSSGPVTLVLPQVSSLTAQKFDLKITHENGDVENNNITIQRSGTDTIIGETAAIVNSSYSSLSFYSSPRGWFIH